MANGKKPKKLLVDRPISPEEFENFLSVLTKLLVATVGLRDVQSIFSSALKIFGVSDDAAIKRLTMYLHDWSHHDLENINKFHPDL